MSLRAGSGHRMLNWLEKKNEQTKRETQRKKKKPESPKSSCEDRVFDELRKKALLIVSEGANSGVFLQKGLGKIHIESIFLHNNNNNNNKKKGGFIN
jgi:DNA-binding IscR family transcriptional regulator